MSQKRILITGATGYLGKYLVKEAKKQGYWVRALARNPKKLEPLKDSIDELFTAEVTDRASLTGVCDGIDYVISSLGITRQKDGMTYMDVDCGGNRNLLDIALKSGVSKFIYVSVINAHLMPDLKIIRAKERFVQELQQSGIDHTIIRPTGFFSDMLEFLLMAEKGKVNLFGAGDYRINPIHGKDLAELCIAAFEKSEKEIAVGGPETFTHYQIAEMAFATMKKPVKIAYMPIWMKDAILRLTKLFTSSKTYGPMEFVWTALSMDGVAPAYGNEKLKDYFQSSVEQR